MMNSFNMPQLTNFKTSPVNNEQFLDFTMPTNSQYQSFTGSEDHMFTISIIGQKGGTGKTTVALGLAVAAFRAGQVVAVIDLDPQASAANWKDRRSDDSPAVVSAQSSRLKQTLATAEEIGAEVVIIDTRAGSDDAPLTPRATPTSCLSRPAPHR